MTITHLHYIRNGKQHEITFNEVKKPSFEKHVVAINDRLYELKGDNEEARFLFTHIQEFSSHQNITSTSLKTKISALGVEGSSIEFTFLQTIEKTKKLVPNILSPTLHLEHFYDKIFYLKNRLQESYKKLETLHAEEIERPSKIRQVQIQTTERRISYLEDVLEQIKDHASQLIISKAQDKIQRLKKKIDHAGQHLNALIEEKKSTPSKQKKIESLKAEIQDWKNEIKDIKTFTTEELFHIHFEENLPGCTFVMMKEGNIVYHFSSGVADFESQEKMTLDAPQHYGSVSKQFTAMAILLLAEEGQVNLDKDIHEYLPGLPLFLFEGKEVKITVKNLLEMRSGLPEVLTYAFIVGKEDQDLTAEQKLEPLFLQKKLDLAFKPDTDMMYCNTNYYLLAEVVLKASGMNLKDYADANIFGPLKMTHTHFIDFKRPVLEQTIKGYETKPEGMVKECTTRNMTWGACGVIGPPREMALWDANFIHNQLGKKDPRLIREFTSASFPLKKEELEYGKGLYVGELGNYKIERHSGGIEGFTTEFIRVTNTQQPEEYFSFFLASNRTLDPYETVRILGRGLTNLWLENTIFPTEKKQPVKIEKERISSSKEDLSKFSGTYLCEALVANYECKVEEREGMLGLVLKKLKNPNITHDTEKEIFFLIPEKKRGTRFHSLNIPSAHVEFSEVGFSFSDSTQGILNLNFKKT